MNAGTAEPIDVILKIWLGEAAKTNFLKCVLLRIFLPCDLSDGNHGAVLQRTVSNLRYRLLRNSWALTT